MTTLHVITLAMCLVLFAFMAWKESVRPNRRFLPWRLLASALSVAAFACIVLPVGITAPRTERPLKEAVLLSEGFRTDSLQHFLRDQRKDLPVFTMDKNLLQAGLAFNTQLADLDFFEEGKQQYQNLHVFGYGLDETLLKNLNRQPIAFHPSPKPGGIASVSWTNKIRSGQELVIQGIYRNDSRQATKLLLSGLHTNLDSAMVPAGKEQDFELRTRPKHIDRAVYSLVALSGRDTMVNEALPVEVSDIKPLRILILAASPDFENKFLKNWLSANAYEVLVRTAISKNKYDKEYLNMPELSFDALTPSLLEKFDIMISDAAELTAINSRELSAIRFQVEQGQLGLIVKADSSISKTSFYSRPFPLYHADENVQKDVSLLWATMRRGKPMLNMEDMVFTRNLPGTQALISDQQSRVLVNSSLYGSGKIILTALNNTYTWMLGGNDGWYQSLWSFLISKAMRTAPSKEKWTISPALPRIDEPAELSLATSSPDLPVARVQENSIFLKQDLQLPFVWSGTWWPSETGWQPFVQSQGQPYWQYVFNSNDWKSIFALKKMKQTRQYESLHQPGQLRPAPDEALITKQVPLFYFFILFIICLSFLWIEKKSAAIDQ